MTIRISVTMGGTSDWETMREACQILGKFGVSYEKKVVSTHRTSNLMFEYAQNARERRIRVITAGTRGAAHLPDMVTSETALPVIGIPVQSWTLNGLDSLFPVVQASGGVPVATTTIGKAGAINAGLPAIQIPSIHDLELEAKLAGRHSTLAKTVIKSND